MIRVLFDARLADPSRHGGIGRWAASMWPRLAGRTEMTLIGSAAGSHRSGNDGSRTLPLPETPHGPGVDGLATPRVVLLGARPFGVAEQWAVPRLAARLRPDVLCLPAFNGPVFQPVPTVVCIHDLIHLRYPRYYGWRKVLYYRLIVRAAVRNAVAVVTVSEFSKGEIVQDLGVPAEKVHVIPNGVEDLFLETGRQPKGRSQGPVGGLFPYVMAVVNPKPHKNAVAVVEAFRAAITMGAPPDLHLVIVGDPGPEAMQVAGSPEVAGRMRVFPRLGDQDMAALYAGAECLLFPSLYEGFGLPVIEAMACGTPVVTSRLTSIPEVAGEAALYVNPLDIREMARAVLAVVSDPALRAHLREQGRERARRFSWDRAADRLLELLAHHAGPGSGSGGISRRRDEVLTV